MIVKLSPNSAVLLLFIMIAFSSCQSTQQLSCPNFKNRPHQPHLVQWKKEKKPLTRWVKTKEESINKQERKPLRKVVERLQIIPTPTMIQAVKPSLTSLSLKKGILFRPKVALKEQDLQQINTEKKRFSKPNIFLPKKVHKRVDSVWADSVWADSVWADSISAPKQHTKTLSTQVLPKKEHISATISTLPAKKETYFLTKHRERGNRQPVKNILKAARASKKSQYKSPNQELLPIKVAFSKKTDKKQKEKIPLSFADKLAFWSLMALLLSIVSLFIPYLQLGAVFILIVAAMLGVCSMFLGAERYKWLGFISAGLGGLFITLSIGLGLAWLIVALLFWQA